MKTPSPSPEQALHVLEILGKWTARGWTYFVHPTTDLKRRVSSLACQVVYTNPADIADQPHESLGVDHFDALCQATTVMQMLLAEHPESP